MSGSTPIQRNWMPHYNVGSSLRSPLDPDDLTNIHKKDNATKGSTFNLAAQVQQHTVMINKLRRRIITPPQTPQSQVLPINTFQIYKTTNTTDSSKSDFTFQIRDGIVGYRSNFLLPGFSIAQTRDFYQGNYELPLVATGTDDSYFITTNSPWNISSQPTGLDFNRPATPNTGPTIAVNIANAGGASDGLMICENKPGTSSPPNVQIWIDWQSGGATGFCVSFWVVLIDDSSVGPYTQLWCRMASDSGFSNPSFYNIDSGTALILQQSFCIGEIYYSNGYGPNIIQYQDGNLINRYLEKPPFVNVAGGNAKFTRVAQVERGYWTFDNLSGGLFYPGDVVVDDSSPQAIIPGTGGSSPVNYYNSYLYVANHMNIESALGGAGWTKYGLILR